MDLSENLLLIKATMVVLGVLVVAWYTWNTHKFRMATVKQQQLIANQVSTLRQDLQSELAREQEASRPSFKWGGGRRSAAEIRDYFVVTCEFQNEGAPIANLEVKPLNNADVEAVIAPHERISEKQRGQVRLASPCGKPLSDIRFEIHYTTRLKRKGKMLFCLPPTSVTPSELYAGRVELNCSTPVKLNAGIA